MRISKLQTKKPSFSLVQSVDKSTLFSFLGKINLGDNKYVN